MKILINKSVSGLKNDFAYDCFTGEVSRDLQESIFWRADRINHLTSLLGLKNYQSLSSEYSDILKVLKVNPEDVDWENLLGNDLLKARLKNILRSLDENRASLNDYIGLYLPVRLKLFERLTEYIYDNQLQSPLKYEHSQTVTGRTVIKKGLNLMTLKKDKRKNLKSKYPGGAIIELDIKSLEPRLYLSLVKNTSVEDAYTYLLKNVLGYNHGEIDRKQIKLAFISLLYGASTNKIKSITRLNEQDIKKIKDFLDVRSFEQKIVNDYNANGYFENAYGRRITSINAPINYYIQSTAADYACIIYEALLSKLSSNGIDLIATIHDAVILDCQKDKIDEVMSVKSFNEEILNITSYFNVERHS